ncbi:MAG: Rrf2 family transcriptional regulator [Edaphobacter sp.]
MISSQHGAMGGYALARPAKFISTLDVISAFDGPPVITSCTTIHGTCEMMHHCIVKEPLRRVNDSIKTLLSSISVADLSESVDSDATHFVGGLVSISH